MTSKGTWYSGTVVSGHGVASGRSDNSPYPAGTIALQTPYFAARGIDLSDCWPGTINLSFAPHEVKLHSADYCFPDLLWTEHHPPETFSFWRIEICLDDDSAIDGWIYRPHPETKQRHWQPNSMLELLAPSLPGVVIGGALSIRDHADRIRVINTARLRARLLEFLKFRVLASQDLFFQNTEGKHRREWLGECYPEALDLDDQVLDQIWAQAKSLYTEH